MAPQPLDPDAVSRWKADTRAAYIRLFALDDKAQDDGLTAEERAEYDRLTVFTSQRLTEFLIETRRS